MAGQTVTRAQLSEAVYQEVGLSRNESADLVETVLNEIADALFLSPATVRTHVTRTMTKLNAHSRAQLVVLAVRAGLTVTP